MRRLTLLPCWMMVAVLHFTGSSFFPEPVVFLSLVAGRAVPLIDSFPCCAVFPFARLGWKARQTGVPAARQNICRFRRRGQTARQAERDPHNTRETYPQIPPKTRFVYGRRPTRFFEPGAVNCC